MFDDNDNFRLDDNLEEENEDEYSSLKDKLVNIIENGSEEEYSDDNIDVTTELDVNRRNREGYEQLMKESSVKLDGYWDVNDPFIKILLICLLIFIVIGSIIVFGSYLGS